MHNSLQGERSQRRPDAWGRVLKRIAALAGVLSTTLIACGVLGAVSASGNEYTAMLANEVSLNSPAFQSVPANSVWQQQFWSAPVAPSLGASAIPQPLSIATMEMRPVACPLGSREPVVALLLI